MNAQKKKTTEELENKFEGLSWKDKQMENTRKMATRELVHIVWHGMLFKRIAKMEGENIDITALFWGKFSQLKNVLFQNERAHHEARK